MSLSCCGLGKSTKVREFSASSKKSDGDDEVYTQRRPPSKISVKSSKSCQLNDKTVPLGVSLEFIHKFLDDRPDIRAERLTTSQINRRYIQTETKGTNRAYLYKFTTHLDDKMKRFIAPATVFVSHAWRYSFVEVVDVMEQHEEITPDHYFWFDLFTNDQNNVAYKDYEWFSETFAGAIQSIGEVLLVMSPWNNPLPLTRAWCLFEISLTLDMWKNVRFVARLPKSQISPLEGGVRADPGCILQALADIQAQNAEASSQTDKETIFSVIQKSKGGFQNINRRIKDYLREWYAQTLVNILEEEDKNDAELYGCVAHVMTSLGRTDKALEYNQKRLMITKTTVGEDHRDTASSYNNIGLQYFNKGQYEQALEYYYKSLSIEKAKFGERHVGVASTYNNIGSVHRSKGDLDKALEFFQKSLDIKESLLGENSSDSATSINSIAGIFYSKGDLDKALQYYLRTLEIRQATVGENHSLTATAYNNIGTICARKKGYKMALEYYHKALMINKATLGKFHSDTAISYNNVGSVYEMTGEIDKALEFYFKSLTIKQATIGENHSDTAKSYNNIGTAYKRKRDLDTALQYYMKALDITKLLLGEKHHETVIIHKNISRVYRSKGMAKEAEEYEQRF